MIAGPREERLNVLSELVRWAHVEAEARERGDHDMARAASKRMREAVSLLGFDPIEYDVGRDWAAVVVRGRVAKMLKAMPGTTAEIARAAGLHSRHVYSYLTPLVNRGEVKCTRTRSTSTWEVVR